MKYFCFIAVFAALIQIIAAQNKTEYFVDLMPVFNQTTVFIVDIVNEYDYSDSIFDIYFSIANGTDEDCLDPHISFEYERIDYDSTYEYLAISQNDGTIIKKCGGGKDSNACGVFKTCLDMYNLRDVDVIYAEDSDSKFYKISLMNSYAVNALCPNSSLELNARLTMYCLATPAPPTTQPTSAPTSEYCGYAIENQSCYEYDEVINPSFTQKTKFATKIQNIDENRETTFYVSYTIANGANDCVDPKLSFEYERIDYDQEWEYIDISDNRDGFLKRCQFSNLSNSCNSFATCLDEYDVKLSKISASGDPYVVELIESSEVDAFCYNHSYSINAKLTLTCSDGTAIPTAEPTTAQPTPPTTEPAALTCDDTIEGYLIHPHDIDWYRVEFAGADMFNVTFDSCNSSYDTYLWLKDMDAEDENNTIAHCDDCGNCGSRTQLYVPGLMGGNEYLLGIGGYSSSHGYYTLDILCDYVADPVTCGDTFSGITSYNGDINWNPLVLEKDWNSVMIDSCDDYTEFDTYLYLKNSTGDIIHKCDDCGDCNGKAQMEIKNVTKGVYKIGIGGFKSGHGKFNIDVVCKDGGGGHSKNGGNGGGSSVDGVTVVISVVAVIVVILLVITFVYYKKKTDKLQAQLSGSSVVKAIGNDQLLINDSTDQAPLDQNVSYQKFDDDNNNAFDANDNNDEYQRFDDNNK